MAHKSHTSVRLDATRLTTVFAFGQQPTTPQAKPNHPIVIRQGLFIQLGPGR